LARVKVGQVKIAVPSICVGYAGVNRAAARAEQTLLARQRGDLANEYDRVHVEVFCVTSDPLAGKEYECDDKWGRAPRIWVAWFLCPVLAHHAKA